MDGVYSSRGLLCLGVGQLRKAQSSILPMILGANTTFDELGVRSGVASPLNYASDSSHD